MTITALASTGQQTRTIGRSSPLLRVMAWEFRRFFASRLFWLQALCFFCFLLFLTWSQQAADQFTVGTMANASFSVSVAGTSAWGLLEHLPTDPLLLLGLLLPFIMADGVTRDLQRRTHELLMTTVLPTWAYVWGRYLTGLLLSLGLSVLALAAILGMGLLLHLTVPAYPLPPIGAVLLLWVGMIVPATVLVSSLSFALGTLLPRQSTLVKIVILMAWFVGAVILPAGFRNTSSPPPTWYVNWDPTSAATAIGILPQYSLDFHSQTSKATTSAARWQQIILTVENKLPDITGWLASHLLLTGFGLLLVLVAALAFKRSRETLS
jgi:ABC-type transport system involved in multi-copper enzyme maturation permease subunit